MSGEFDVPEKIFTNVVQVVKSMVLENKRFCPNKPERHETPFNTMGAQGASVGRSPVFFENNPSQ